MSGTISEFYAIHGVEAVQKLAVAAGTKLSYLQQLNSVPGKKPSKELAERLVAEAARLPYSTKLTMDGLMRANAPLKQPRRRPAAS